MENSEHFPAIQALPDFTHLSVNPCQAGEPDGLQFTIYLII